MNGIEIYMPKLQKDKFMNRLFVNNVVFGSISNDNFQRLLTKQTMRWQLGLFMKRNQQMTNKENTALLKWLLTIEVFSLIVYNLLINYYSIN